MQYALGKYIEDYEYVQGLGHLDQYNGRVCVTPEYPLGTYAYFVTIDSNQVPVYPYTIGASYNGVVAAGNTGMQSGHNTIPGNAALYTAPTTGINETTDELAVNVFPNPAKNKISIQAQQQLTDVALTDITGREVVRINNISSSNSTIDVSGLSAGTYLLRAKNNRNNFVTKVVVE